jgi:hypothetical protein
MSFWSLDCFACLRVYYLDGSVLAEGLASGGAGVVLTGSNLNFFIINYIIQLKFKFGYSFTLPITVYVAHSTSFPSISSFSKT